MSKRGGATRRGGRFLSTEDEERLRGNILRRNSLREREEGSEVSATEEMEQVLVENPENDSVAGRVRRLEGGQGGAVSVMQSCARIYLVKSVLLYCRCRIRDQHHAAPLCPPWVPSHLHRVLPLLSVQVLL